jgi:hypothetical protein
MAVRGAQLTYGARRVSRRRFRVGGYQAFQPEFMDGRPRSSISCCVGCRIFIQMQRGAL